MEPEVKSWNQEQYDNWQEEHKDWQRPFREQPLNFEAYHNIMWADDEYWEEPGHVHSIELCGLDPSPNLEIWYVGRKVRYPDLP